MAGSLRADIQALRADMHAMETRHIRWLIGTVVTVSALVFSIAKLVN